VFVSAAGFPEDVTLAVLPMGTGNDLAATLAVDREIDLHALLKLVDRGCPPELAVRILAPLDAEWPRA
jgi:diacylglycerol kinase family enzyme